MDAKIILTRSDITKLPMTWYGSQDGCGERELSKALKVLTGNRWDSGRVLFSNVFGALFVLHISPKRAMKGSIYCDAMGRNGTITYDEENKTTNLFSWALWNSSGQSSLGNGDFFADPDKPLPREILRQIEKLSELWTQGKMPCSGCGKEIGRHEIAGRYFAGCYCTDCWESKWKAIEAAETYN